MSSIRFSNEELAARCYASSDLLARAADGLGWALDLIDMYDERMVQFGDPKEKVYSDLHVRTKAQARRLIAELLANGEVRRGGPDR